MVARHQSWGNIHKKNIVVVPGNRTGVVFIINSTVVHRVRVVFTQRCLDDTRAGAAFTIDYQGVPYSQHRVMVVFIIHTEE